MSDNAKTAVTGAVGAVAAMGASAKAAVSSAMNRQAIDSSTVPVPLLKDYYENDYRNKNSKILNKLDTAIDALKDMKDIMKDSNTKEPYIADLPIPPESLFDERTELIEGFENQPSYHHF
jgi:hypothetical protein